ncbi:MAG: DUF3187 family protein [Proteobacteria bacterium]|nr:DUF3187 family protein [Pseudomonadota bacterium]MBU1714440.1 DUF3187 family protein [Pseudomonadota bacterium]
MVCRSGRHIVTLLVVWALISPLDVFGATPFYSKNLSPFALIYGLPANLNGNVVEEGRTEVRLHAEAANNFVVRQTGDTLVVFDGETYRTAAVFSYGLKDRLEIGMELPYITHAEGVLDYFIADWHEFFRLPKVGRDKRPNAVLEYRYVQDGKLQYLVDTPSSGMGDLVLFAGYRLYRDRGPDYRATALRASLKLPTGSATDLHGSGGWDVSLALAGTDNKTFFPWNLSVYGALGLMLTGSSEVLNDIRQDLVGFGSLGLGWQGWSRLELKLQIDTHTPLYDSSFDELGSIAAQLNIGGTVSFSDETLLDINVTEDIIVDSMPDVSFQLSLRQIF